MPLKIVVVGGGIAGLSAAIALTRNGHHVDVYERRDPSQQGESGSGIGLMQNAIRILSEWEMLPAFQQSAHLMAKTELRMHDGTVITHIDRKISGVSFYGLRGVLNSIFRDAAIREGATLHDHASVDHVLLDGPAVVLDDGSMISADLIVGADGSNSRVRKQLFPDYKPRVLNMACFQIHMSLSEIEQDPLLRQVAKGPYTIITLAPGRHIYASPAPAQDSFDMQLVDQEYPLNHDPHPHLINERITDLKWLRQRFADHGPAYRLALDNASSAFKWRFMEVRGLPAWSKGRIVLVGDSCHSMVPFSGQGSAQGIEDAAILAALLPKGTTPDKVEEAVSPYERIRRPRVERIQELADSIGKAWTIKDSEGIARRNAKRRERKYDTTNAVPDMNASFDSPEFLAWLEHPRISAHL